MNNPLELLGAANRAHYSIKMKGADLASINISFSLNGADLAIIRGYLKDQIKTKVPGFYADIGCAHHTNISNTYLLYAIGWSGICVDANPEIIQPFAQHRPRDKVIHAAISSHEGQLHWSRHLTNPGMSAISVEAKAGDAEYAESIPVPSAPLKNILPRDRAIDFMSIDVEGHELPALQSNEWNSIRPRLILLETLGLDPEKPTDHPSVSFLSNQGYRICGILNDNVFMRC